MSKFLKISFLDSCEAKITEDGFVWKTISYEQARILHHTGVIALFALYEDDSESEIESAEDIMGAESKGIDIGIEVGFLQIGNNGER